MQRGLALSSFLLASTLHAQEDSYRHAYLSHVEGEVSLQRAAESEPESGSLNVPLLPGDRLWTRAASRAEIRFGSGLVVHLSEGAKLDFVATDPETILRLWSGSAILTVPEPPGALRLDSPAGSIRPTIPGSYRIDIDGEDAVTISVERGSVELANSLGTVLVQSGETSGATSSAPPSIPVKFNTARLDDFDRWSASRAAGRARTEDIVVRSLPHQVQSYADDLADHGDWYPEQDYGYVWYPRVEVGWAPYTYGHWGYTNYGNTWISSEPWGWAPYHYGRWGFGHRGWYWIPGATWGPAWVSFAIGPTWVGWGPLGYHNQPVFAFNAYYGGYGGGYYGHGGYSHHGGGWNVCSRDDFRRGVVTRDGYRSLDPASVRASASDARFVDEISSLDRDLNQRTARVREFRSGDSSPSSSRTRTSEAALQGFRERASTSSRRTLEDGQRSASPRGERTSGLSETVRRGRELQGSTERRETIGRGPTEPARDAARSILRESRSLTERSRGTETREASRPLERAEPVEPVSPTEPAERAQRNRSAFSERRERFETLRGGDSIEARGSRSRAPETRAPEMRSESRTRVERAEPRRGRSMPGIDAPARETSRGARSPRSREQSSSMGAPRAGGGGQGGATRGSSNRSGNSRGSARGRSNRS